MEKEVTKLDFLEIRGMSPTKPPFGEYDQKYVEPKLHIPPLKSRKKEIDRLKGAEFLGYRICERSIPRSG